MDTKIVAKNIVAELQKCKDEFVELKKREVSFAEAICRNLKAQILLAKAEKNPEDALLRMAADLGDELIVVPSVLEIADGPIILFALKGVDKFVLDRINPNWAMAFLNWVESL